MQFKGREINVGDKLVSSTYGELVVKSIEDGKTYPIVAQGTKDTYLRTFTVDGEYVKDQGCILFWPDETRTEKRFKWLIQLAGGDVEITNDYYRNPEHAGKCLIGCHPLRAIPETSREFEVK